MVLIACVYACAGMRVWIGNFVPVDMYVWVKWSKCVCVCVCEQGE